MLKKCPRCKETKPYADYHKSKHTKRGIQSYCRACMNTENERQRQIRIKNGPTIKRDSKECQRCHNIKPISQFSARNDGPDGHSSYCKPCWVIITRAAQMRQVDRQRNI